MASVACRLIRIGIGLSLVLPLVFHAEARSRQADERKITLGTWQLSIERSKFSRDINCHLADRKHHVVYAAGALGFRFKRHTNTLGAWISIDGEQPSRWQDELPALTKLGAPMDGPNLDDPMDSTVWIPASRLEDANRVTIQPRENKRPTTFHLRGFAGLREIARSMGCTPDARFSP